MTSEEPNLRGIYGGTANPLRQVFMMGAIWRLASDFGGDQLDLVEVGSWAGASALTWGQALHEYNSGRGSLTCIDAWKPYFAPENITDAFGREISQALEADEPYQVFLENIKFVPSSIEVAVLPGWSSDILPTLREDGYHLIYLDGDHSYKGVAQDIKLACPLIRDGGIICGDDLELQNHEVDGSWSRDHPGADKWTDHKTGAVFHPGVSRAVAERFGVVSSWYGFWAMRRDGDSWVEVSLEGMPGHIPVYLDIKNLMGLKALLMQLH